MITVTAYASPDGYHRHKCHFCGYVWEHSNDNDVRHGDTGAHECPSCHRCNWSLGIYDGPEAPRVRQGVMPSPPLHYVEDMETRTTVATKEAEFTDDFRQTLE